MDCLKLGYDSSVALPKVMYEKSVQTWLSIDPMSDKCLLLFPHVYCFSSQLIIANPNGMEVCGDYFNWYGKYLGTDGKKDNNVFIVSDNKSLQKIKRYPTGNKNKMPIDNPSGEAGIHSHPLKEHTNGNIYTTETGKDDPEIFSGYNLTIIVRDSNCNPESFGCERTPEATFYDSKTTEIGTMKLSDIKKRIDRQ